VLSAGNLSTTPHALDLVEVESLGSVLAHLEKWGISTDEVYMASIIVRRLARLRVEWPDDGSVTPRRSELSAVEHTALLFLHMKDLMADEYDADRVAAFRKVVLGPGPRPPSPSPKWWLTAFKRHQRLMHLIHLDRDVTWEGPLAGPAPPGMRGIQLWEDFVAHHPEWTAPGGVGAIVFFHHTCPGSLRQRAQIHGTCYMQAPNVLVHYLCCLHYKSEGPGDGAVPAGTPTMTDLTKLKLRHYDPVGLWNFIHDDSGRSAVEFLEQLCASPDFDTTELSGSRLTADNIVRNLTKYGPALVSSFVVKGWCPQDDPVWPGSGADHHAGAAEGDHPVKEPDLYHAVLIVGHRTCGDGTVHFLIQNWWLEKQFFTCDVGFLRARLAKLAWVTTPVKQVCTLLPDEVVTAHVAFSAPDGAATCGVFTV
jgi:hypothetical protein